MRFPLIAPLFVLVAMSASPVFAQSPNGNINGLVSDPSSAAVAGAEVVAVNDVTSVQYTTKTNHEGIYVLPSLSPGPYRLQVSKAGFKTVIKPDIVLNVQDALSVNFTLPVGAAFEIITVEGGAPLVNTESADVSTVVDQTYVKNMPLNGRSFQDLILLTPGTVTQTPQSSFGQSGLGFSGEFSVNGQRVESNYYTVDGVSANVGVPSSGFDIGGAGASGSLSASTALGTTQSLVSVDALQEFRVHSSTYSAEYGRNPGGQFSFQTKSGTNQFHGTAYDYLRNNYFDANDWFNNYFGVKGADLRQNDFGATVGGPVRVPSLYDGKDKTFFFFSYEGLRLTTPQPASSSFVPDLCMRGVIGQCPSGRQPAPDALLPVMNAFPMPSTNGVEDATNGFGQYVGSWSNRSSIDSTSIRFDHFVNDKLRVFFRFSDTASSLAVRGNAGNAATTFDTSAYTLRTYTAGASSIFSNRLSNEFRLNYSSNGVTSRPAIDAFGGGVPINLFQLTGLGPNANPDVEFFYGESPFLFQEPLSGTQKQWNFVDTVSLFMGRHQFKFGVDYRRVALVSTRPNPHVGYDFFSESEVQTNSPSIFAQANASVYPVYVNVSGFAQDEWKVSQILSLSLGLRWEVNPAPGVTRGLEPYTIEGSDPNTWTLAPQGTPLWRTTWYNLAPRLGLAYILHSSPGYELVVRGGGGVFFDTGQQAGSTSFEGPGFSVSSSQPGSFPIVPSIPVIVNPPVPPYADIIGFSPHLQLPYTLQWNATIEQQLGKSQALTISYIGSHAARLVQENSFTPTNNPDTSRIVVVQNGRTSDYDSSQVQFRRRLSSGLTALVSYTWSHCIDYGSLNYDFGYQRGNCDFDVRNNLSAAFSYDLPNLGGDALLNRVIRHWGFDGHLTARTSFPVTLVGNTLVDPITGQQLHAGLNLVPDQPVYLYGDNCTSTLQGLGDLAPGESCPGRRAINPNAFANVSSGFGTAPRNFTRGFGAWQMNVGVRREFPIREMLKLQFRAEAFNVFNHPNFGAVDPFFGDRTFGQADSTLANSLGILNPLYQMGGPRSMQFALKLIF
jgi:hypothetical protein